jgi:hypothetical protein
MIRFRERDIFTLALLALVGFMSYFTARLGPVARLVPTAVALPTLALLVFQLAADLLPSLERRYRRFEKVDLLGVESIRKKVPEPDLPAADGMNGQSGQNAKEWGLFLWVLLVPGLVYLLGLLVALPLYVLLHLRCRSRESLALSLSLACGTGLALYGIFVFALRIRLFEGYLWLWLGSWQ